MSTAADKVRIRARKVDADLKLTNQFIEMVKEGSTLFPVRGNSKRWQFKGEIAHWNERSPDGRYSIDWELTVRTVWNGMLRTVTTRIEERRYANGEHTCRTYNSAARVI